MNNTLKALLIPALFCALLFQGILFLHKDFSGPGIVSLNQAYFTASDAMKPSALVQGKGEPRTLPDNWNVSQRGIGGSGWYELHVQQLERHQKLWGIFIPRINMNTAVFINGVEIGSSGVFTKPIGRNWARPIYYGIPAGNLSVGDNIIQIHIKAYANDGGGISKVLLGEHDILFPLYEGRYFLQIDMSMMAVVLNIFAGLIALTLWLFRRRDAIYGWFSLVSFTSAFFISNQFIRDIPVDREVWQWAVHISIGWFSFGLLAFALRFVECDRLLLERLLTGYMILSSIILLLLDNTRLFLLWHIGSLSMVAYACILLFKKWLELKQPVDLFVFCALLITLVLGFHDWGTRLSNLQFSYPVLMHLGPALMLMSISWILIIRFIQSANQNEQFNEILTQRIEATKAALNIEHQKVQHLLQQEAQAQERDRIMKDLHDGLGRYLMAAHSMAQLNDADKGLQQALNDAVFWLRSSLDSGNEDIGAMLGTLRYRLDPQLKACGITLHWQMDDLSEHRLSSEGRLHLMRIVQEAITNVIKHAQASSLSISITVQPDKSIRLHIQDDGCGFSGSKEGHGMSNMRSRIEAIGGKLELLSGENGTSLSFVFKTS
ncbi:hypothetical protein JYT48_01085 [Mariprofundus ferrooxydans]|nr:hypothetical protein [Mariprofundus ferrooxydans]